MFYLAICYAVIAVVYINQVSGIIVSPCKVRNIVTYPRVGTSLKSKTLVNIIQIPPVFTQNVMIGICETKDENLSSGKAGEFYMCQQRYSAMEVYIADASSPPTTGDQSPSSLLANLKFIRESVIIQSGCDFTFNLLPFLSDAAATQAQAQQGNALIQQQQKAFLHSPYHPNPNPAGNVPFRTQPPQTTPAYPPYGIPQGPVATSENPYQNPYQNYLPPQTPTNTYSTQPQYYLNTGRASDDENVSEEPSNVNPEEVLL